MPIKQPSSRNPSADGRARLVALFLLAVIVLGVFHFIRHRRAVRAHSAWSSPGPLENSANAPAGAPAQQDHAGASADCATTNIGYRVLTIAGKPVALWYPTAAQPATHSYNSKFSSAVAFNAPASTVCGKKVPLVLFSHGDLGCGLQSVFFTEELARHGYVVAAPDHDDAFLCHTVQPQGQPRRPKAQRSIFKPATWDDRTFADRRDDLEAIIAQLLADPEFADIIDPQEIGAAGHSLGGYTVVGLAGGWPSWFEPRIRAVVAFSPYVMPFQSKKTLSNVRVPLMYQGGTLDVGITPFLKGKSGAFALANPPVYFMVLRRAAHFAWVNCGNAHTTASCLAHSSNVRLICDYAIAFFNSYLKHVAEPILEKPNPALAEYKFRAAGSLTASTSALP